MFLWIPYNFIVGHVIEYLKEECKTLLFLFELGDILIDDFDLFFFEEMRLGFG